MPRDGWDKAQTNRRIKNGGIAASVFVFYRPDYRSDRGRYQTNPHIPDAQEGSENQGFGFSAYNKVRTVRPQCCFFMLGSNRS
jgi:hypothetical protein